MTENLLNNELIYRGCILYEFLRGKPIFETYQKLCEVFGDSVDYRDFEFWFLRFEKGEMDLNYDKSLEPKNDLYLAEMPIEILESIVDKLDLMERHAVRKVCRYFQTAIDNRAPEITGIQIYAQSFETRICYDWKKVVYKDTSDGCWVKYGERKKKITGEDHLKLALDDLSIVMKHPKFQLETFHVELDTYILKREQFVNFKRVFNSFNHQLNVKHVFILILDPYWSILPYLKPGKLEVIHLKIHAKKLGILEKIAKSEQWRQAKEVKIEGFGYSLPIDNLFHFLRFNVELDSLTRADMIEIRDVLMKSDSFVWCLMTFFYPVDFDDFEQVFESNFNLDGVLTYKVPDTGNVFEIEQLLGDSIQIQKL